MQYPGDGTREADRRTEFLCSSWHTSPEIVPKPAAYSLLQCLSATQNEQTPLNAETPLAFISRHPTTANAGQSPVSFLGPRRGPAHPRLRGEDMYGNRRAVSFRGSPPLARGRPFPATFSSFIFRLTPACAGKTHSPRLPAELTWAHPRLRGEDVCHQVAFLSGKGSPPLARGRLVNLCRAHRRCRLTPACAGKTQPCNAHDCQYEAHPRLRGEDLLPVNCLSSPSGSPPLARGRPELVQVRQSRIRLTPACAGKTVQLRQADVRLLAHPSLRGDY